MDPDALTRLIDQTAAARARAARLLAAMADAAETLAETSEHIASYWEAATVRGDTERRRALAEWQRAVAEVERRNVDRLRAGRLGLEKLPPPPEEAPEEY